MCIPWMVLAMAKDAQSLYVIVDLYRLALLRTNPIPLPIDEAMKRWQVSRLVYKRITDTLKDVGLIAVHRGTRAAPRTIEILPIYAPERFNEDTTPIDIDPPVKAKRRQSVVCREAAVMWNEEWETVYGNDNRYIWQWKGQYTDSTRVRSWMHTLGVDVDSKTWPRRQMETLREGMREYITQASQGEVWPYDQPPCTRMFTKDLQKWLNPKMRASDGVMDELEAIWADGT